MKSLLLFLLLFIVFSCGSDTSDNSASSGEAYKEEFLKLPYLAFNRELLGLEKLITPEEVIKSYLRLDGTEEPLEGKETIEISNIKLGENKYELTLVHDFLADDSVKAEKYVMRIFRKKDVWQVYTLQKNWICWEGRGHADWGIAPCN